MAANGSNGGAPAVNGRAYPIEDHTFDVVVVGAGGSGLRAWSAAARPACAPPASPRCFPPARIRWRRRAASPPRSATWARTTGAGTCTTPSRGRTGSAIQDAIEYVCKNAPEAVYELEHWGLPFSRREDGGIYQRPFGGMTTHYGKGSRGAPARRPTAPAMPCCHDVRPVAARLGPVLRRVFRDRPDHGRGRPLPRWSRSASRTAPCTASSHMTIWRPAAMGVRISCLRPTCTGDGNAMLLRAGLPLQGHGVRAVPSAGSPAGCLITEGRGEGPIWSTARASASWSATRPPPRTSPRATSSRAR